MNAGFTPKLYKMMPPIRHTNQEWNNYTDVAYKTIETEQRIGGSLERHNNNTISINV